MRRGSRSAGAVGSLELLAGRARAGDRRAAAQLRTRMTPQVSELARALSADSRAVPTIVRHALNDALADERRPYTWALVAAVQRRSAAVRGRTGGRQPRTSEKRLLAAIGVLCDMQGHTHSSAAALLGEPVTRVAALHAQARSEIGVDRARTHCRGWNLVSRLDDLTPPEQVAGRRHLETCRPCEEALAARAAARLRIKAALPVGGTVIGGGIVAAFAAIGGGSAGAGAAAVGAAAVLGTAGTVAVAVPPAPPPPPPAPVAPTEVTGVAPADEPAEPVAPVEGAVVPAAPVAPGIAPAPPPPEARVSGSEGSDPPAPAPTSPPPPSEGPALPPELLDVVPTEVPIPEVPLVEVPLPTSIPVLPRPQLSVDTGKDKSLCLDVLEPVDDLLDVVDDEPDKRKPGKTCHEALEILPSAPDHVELEPFANEAPALGLGRLRDLREPRPSVSREAKPWLQPAP